MVGKTISHYRIVEKLGEGGMGVVYKAHDTKLDRDVALKFLPATLHPSPEDLERFEQEARAISALNHANIATIHDIDEYEGQKYLVLEYIPGGTLKSKLKQLKSEDKEFSIRDVIEYGIQIAKALAHAHQHGIIHRDVKTDNIMLMEDGTAKLTDFGLAKLRRDMKLTKTGSTVGTVAYMSPEQVRGEEVDNRSDSFSLGVVLYELVTTHLPFRGEFETAISYSILNENPPSLRTLRKDVPAAFENIIQHCLEKQKEKRYNTADEIVTELQKIRQQVTGNPEGRKKTKFRLVAATSLIVLVVIGIALFMPSSKPKIANNKTIAVLPFVNLSGNQEDEYFTDGIMEDILTQLSKIGELNVISRTTMMQYKGIKKSLKDIGNELHAGVVLEGSARRSGNRIRISSQLIDAETDKHLWAETYDRDLNDVFTIQSDVAKKIAEALALKLAPHVKQQIEKKSTQNMEAYDYYLKGREYYYRYKKQDNERAIELFKKAISLDSGYALAWAGLGDAYAQRPDRYGYPAWWLDSASIVIHKAIEIDSSSAEAYKALGNVYILKGYKDSSLTAYLRAINFNSNYLPAITQVGRVYTLRGEFSKAIPWYNNAVRGDPLIAGTYANLGNVYRIMGEYGRAEQYLQKASDLQIDNKAVFMFLTQFYLSQGRDQEATNIRIRIAASDYGNPSTLEWAGDMAAVTGNLTDAKQYYQRSLALRAPNETINDSSGGTMLAYIYMKEGKRIQAEKIIAKEMILSKEYIKGGNQGSLPEYTLAKIFAIRGERKDACTHLEKAIDRGLRDYQMVVRNPLFENIRNDEEFKKLIADMKVRVEEQRVLVEQMEKEEGGNK